MYTVHVLYRYECMVYNRRSTLVRYYSTTVQVRVLVLYNGLLYRRQEDLLVLPVRTTVRSARPGVMDHISCCSDKVPPHGNFYLKDFYGTVPWEFLLHHHPFAHSVVNAVHLFVN